MANILQKNNKDQVFDNGNIKIHDNLLSTSTGIVQIANISRVYVAKLPQQSYILGGIIFFVGLVICCNRGGMPAGLLIAAVGGAMVLYAYQKNNANKYGLFVEMNSGGSMIFSSGEKKFLYDVADFLANVIEGNLRADNYSITINEQIPKNAQKSPCSRKSTFSEGRL